MQVWPKIHRDFEPSVYFHSDKVFPYSFKGIGAEYLVHHVALGFPISASPSNSSAGKQLGLCMGWVFSSRLCFYLLVALRVYRVVTVLPFWGGAGRFFLGCVAPRVSTFPVPGWAVLRSVGSWVFQCSLQFCLPMRERKCSAWVWPRTEGAFFLHDNSKPSLIFSVVICISNCYCKCCLPSVQL